MWKHSALILSLLDLVGRMPTGTDGRGKSGGRVGEAQGASLPLQLRERLQGTSGIEVLHESLLANLNLSHDHLLHPSIGKVDGHHLPLPLVHIEDAGKGVKVALQEAVATETQDRVCRREGGESSRET